MNLAVSPSSAVVIFALLAVPLMTALRVLLLRELWIERMDRIGIDPNPPREEQGPPKPRARRLRRAARGLFRS